LLVIFISLPIDIVLPHVHASLFPLPSPQPPPPQIAVQSDLSLTPCSSSV
jgi:hypothetical protein